MMDMIQLIQNRRSCRQFAVRAVEEAKVEILKKALLWSPTSKNNRPWEFVFVNDPELLEKLSECKPHGAAFLSGSPLAVVILANPATSDVWVEDTSIAATLLQLTAEDIGLASCWVQIRKRQHSSGAAASSIVKELLNAPDYLQVACIIAIGYKENKRPPSKEEDLLKERIHLNGF